MSTDSASLGETTMMEGRTSESNSMHSTPTGTSAVAWKSTNYFYSDGTASLERRSLGVESIPTRIGGGWLQRQKDRRALNCFGFTEDKSSDLIRVETQVLI